MKFLKTTSTLLLMCFILSTTIQCSGSKRAHKFKVEDQSPLNYTRPYFQEWIAPIKLGTSGANVFLPNLTTKNNTVIDSVFFRQMMGKLEKGRALYSATLTRVHPDDKQKRAKEFPFDLRSNECVVSYIENGETKYFLIDNIAERAGEYYPDGPPKDIN